MQSSQLFTVMFLCLFGWGAKAQTSSDEPRGFQVSVTVSEGILNMRNGPGQGHALVTSIPAGSGGVRQVGSCVSPDDGKSRNEWCKVEWNGNQGWVSKGGLTAAESERPTDEGKNGSMDEGESGAANEGEAGESGSRGPVDDPLSGYRGARAEDSTLKCETRGNDPGTHVYGQIGGCTCECREVLDKKMLFCPPWTVCGHDVVSDVTVTSRACH